MTAESEMKNEIKDLRQRVSALERLVLNLVSIEKVPRNKLSTEQKNLLEKTLADIQKEDYRDYLTIKEVKKAIRSPRTSTK